MVAVAVGVAVATGFALAVAVVSVVRLEGVSLDRGDRSQATHRNEVNQSNQACVLIQQGSLTSPVSSPGVGAPFEQDAGLLPRTTDPCLRKETPGHPKYPRHQGCSW